MYGIWKTSDKLPWNNGTNQSIACSTKSPLRKTLLFFPTAAPSNVKPRIWMEFCQRYSLHISRWTGLGCPHAPAKFPAAVGSWDSCPNWQEDIAKQIEQGTAKYNAKHYPAPFGKKNKVLFLPDENQISYRPYWSLLVTKAQEHLTYSSQPLPRPGLLSSATSLSALFPPHFKQNAPWQAGLCRERHSLSDCIAPSCTKCQIALVV